MDTQREMKIIIAATVMFHDDTHTEYSLLLTDLLQTDKLSIVPEPGLKSAHE